MRSGPCHRVGFGKGRPGIHQGLPFLAIALFLELGGDSAILPRLPWSKRIWKPSESPYPFRVPSGILYESQAKEGCVMSVKTIGLVVAAAGLLATLIFATGHLIGILSPVFGPKQLAALVVSIVILIVGLVLYILASRKEKAGAGPEAD